MREYSKKAFTRELREGIAKIAEKKIAEKG
jgi:hypothetical protein